MKNKISVIVPVYKVEEYLHRCVDSIINQTYTNLEIILVNDGSPDNSGNICDDYVEKDNRITVIHKANEGSSSARNAGLDIATGDYISFVDSDDHININMLEIMLHSMLEFNLNVVEIKYISKKIHQDNEYSVQIQDKITAFKRIIKSTSFAVWSRMYKTSLIKDLRFIPKIIHQDVFYTIDVLNRIEHIGLIDNYLYYYNTENESIIRSKYSKEKIEIGIRATEYLKNYTPKNAELQKIVNNYITFYYTDHYFLLSRNVKVDPKKTYRKYLKRAIKSTINRSNYNLRSIMVLILPYKIMEYISSTYIALIRR